MDNIAHTADMAVGDVLIHCGRAITQQQWII